MHAKDKTGTRKRLEPAQKAFLVMAVVCVNDVWFWGNCLCTRLRVCFHVSP